MPIAMHIIGVVLLLSIFLAPPLVCATEEYAKQTGKTCVICHRDPGGGGELTAAGVTFSVSYQVKAENLATGIYIKAFRLAIGYIHFLTAIYWFGTILYVHLILKPAYAASGLPRGEMKVGIISMIVMGFTGSILTFYRVTSFNTLLHTKFGILLLVKVALYLVMVLSALFVIIVIGPRLKAKRKEPLLPGRSDEFTPDDLTAYDGKDGHPAYFAFEGKVYDASPSKLWKQGTHMGRHDAGNDLTEALNLAPHGREQITSMMAVGKLITATPRKAPLHERVFFFMAHMNLTIVFIIVLILSLWRWG